MSMQRVLRAKLKEGECKRFFELCPGCSAASLPNARDRANSMAKVEGRLDEFYYTIGTMSGDPLVGRHTAEIARKCHESTKDAHKYTRVISRQYGFFKRANKVARTKNLAKPMVPKIKLPSGLERPAHVVAPYSED